MRKTERGRGATAALVISLASASWLSSCVGDDDARRDTLAGDADGTDADGKEDADGASGETDVGPIAPPGAVLVGGRLVPPGGASPEAWRVMNPYGEATLGADGAFVLPILERGPTLTLALAPGEEEARLALLTARSEASVGEPPALRVDAWSTGIAALLLHPRVTPRAAWRLAPLATIAIEAGALATLAPAIEAAGGVGAAAWTEGAPARAAYTWGLAALLRRASPPWDMALPTDLPDDPAGVVTVRREVPLAAFERTEAGALALAPLPGRPPVLTATVEPLDAGAVTRWQALAGDEPAAIGPAWTSAGPIALEEGLYRVTLEADAQGCGARVDEALAALVASGQETFRTRARMLAGRLAGIDPGVALVADPDHPLAAMIDPRRGPTRETLVVIVGDPFAPRFDGAGRHLDRLVVRDAAGRRRSAHVVAGAAVAPAGLAGALTLVAESAGGTTAERPFGVAPVAVTRVTPSRIAAGSGLVRIEVDGAGFAPGTRVDLGATTVTAPEDATPDRFAVVIDADLLTPGGADAGPLRVVGAPSIGNGPTSVAGGEGARFMTRDATSDLTVSARVEGAEVALPIRLATDEEVVLETTPLPAGAHTLRFDNAAGRSERTLTVTRTTPAHARQVRFAATDPLDRQVYLTTALEIANGQTIAHGEFWLYDTLVVAADGWYCPLDIRPDTAVIAEPCGHWSGVCSERWAWSDTRDPASWFTVTPPPGRLTTGAAHCPPIAGPASWAGVPRADLEDELASDDPVFLAGQVLRGPNVTLALTAARGGGLTIAPPLEGVAGAGARNDVTLDLVVDDATATADRPVVTLDGATGVVIRRLVIRGRPGACAVGLRVEGSRDVTIGALDVRDCDVGVEVLGSSDVRVGAAPTLAAPWPVTIARARTGLVVEESEDVTAHVAIGVTPSMGTGAIVAGLGQRDGVIVRASERVTLAGAVVATPGTAVRIEGAAHARVGPLAIGFIKLLDDTSVTAGAGVGVGLVVADGLTASEDVVVSDARVDQTSGDAIVVAGGRRVRITRGRIGDVVGAIGGVGLRAAFGVAHDLDVDGLDVRGVKAAGVHVAGGGRVDVRRASVVMGPAGGCAMTAASAQGLRVGGATLVGALCVSLSTDVRVLELDARDVVLTGSADVHVERARAERLDVDGGAGIVVRGLEADAVTVTGPLAPQGDPITIVGTTLAAESDAIVVTDARVPVVLDGVTAADARLSEHAGVLIASAALERVTTAGAGRLVVSGGGPIGQAESAGGELVIEGGWVEVVEATGGRLALLDPDGLSLVGASGADVVVSGATVSTLDVARGRLVVRAADVDRLDVLDVDAARVVDVGAGWLTLDGGARARLARVHADGIERVAGARQVRVVDGPTLLDRPGDPLASGRVDGDVVIVTAAPEHALVELASDDGVVARAFVTDGQAVFAGLPTEGATGADPSRWRIATTLPDGATGPAIVVADARAEACVATDAPEGVRVLVEPTNEPICPDAPAGVTPSPDCRVGARIDDEGLVIVDLETGVERAPEVGGEARWPAWEADGSGLWLSRRATGEAPWELVRLDVDNDHIEVVLAAPADVVWPAPSPRDVVVAASWCDARDADDEPAGCRLVLVDRDTGALGDPAAGGWPAARACDTRGARWLPDAAAARLGEGLVVTRRPIGGGEAQRDIVSPIGQALWRLGPAGDQPVR